MQEIQFICTASRQAHETTVEFAHGLWATQWSGPISTTQYWVEESHVVVVPQAKTPPPLEDEPVAPDVEPVATVVEVEPALVVDVEATVVTPVPLVPLDGAVVWPLLDVPPPAPPDPLLLEHAAITPKPRIVSVAKERMSRFIQAF